MAHDGQAGCEPAADVRRVGEQAVGLDSGEHGERGGARHRVAPERAAVVALAQRRAHGAEPDAGADRQPAAQPLGQGEHVRHHAVRLVREPGAGAPDPALDLVDHQQRTGRVTRPPRRAQVSGGGRHHSGLPLAGLDEHGSAVRAHGSRERVRIAVGDKADLNPEGAKRLAYRLFAGQRE